MNKTDTTLETTTCLFEPMASTEKLFDRPDWWLGCPGDFAWHRCPKCGLHILSPRPTIQDIATFYPAHYAAYRKAIDQEDWFLKRWKRRRNLRPSVNAVSGFFAQPGRLLDVGCATGNYLAEMRRRGWSVTGVEIQPDAARYAREQLHLDVFNGDLLEAPFPSQSFDAITLWDVLEHTHNPLAIMQAVRRLLRPGGIVVFSIPDLQSKDALQFGKYWIGFDAPRHLYLFEDRTILELLHRAGLRYLERAHFLGTYHTWVASWQTWLNAMLPANATRRLLSWLAHLPIWAPLTAPYFSWLNLHEKGSVVTIFATAQHDQ